MHVFISYVREDSQLVLRLVDGLRNSRVPVWVDVDDISPGTRWKQAIRNAIRTGDFFLACFSENYFAKRRSYMNHELNLAIEELVSYPKKRAWFIPIMLSDSEIPDIPISATETLRDLQRVDLHQDFGKGVRKLLDVILPCANANRITELLNDIRSDDFTLVQLALTKLISLDQWLEEKGLPVLVDVMLSSGCSDQSAELIYGALVGRNVRSTSTILISQLPHSSGAVMSRIVSFLGRICTPRSIAQVFPEHVENIEPVLGQQDRDHIHYPQHYWGITRSSYENLRRLHDCRRPQAIGCSPGELPVNLDFDHLMNSLKACPKCGHSMMRIRNREHYDSGDWWFEHNYECSFCGAGTSEEIEGRSR